MAGPYVVRFWSRGAAKARLAPAFRPSRPVCAHPLLRRRPERLREDLTYLSGPRFRPVGPRQHVLRLQLAQAGPDLHPHERELHLPHLLVASGLVQREPILRPRIPASLPLPMMENGFTPHPDPTCRVSTHSRVASRSRFELLHDRHAGTTFGPLVPAAVGSGENVVDARGTVVLAVGTHGHKPDVPEEQPPAACRLPNRADRRGRIRPHIFASTHAYQARRSDEFSRRPKAAVVLPDRAHRNRSPPPTRRSRRR